MKLDCGFVLFVISHLLSEHIKSKSHKHKGKFSVVGKENEFIGPQIEKIVSVFDKNARDCYKRYFHK